MIHELLDLWLAPQLTGTAVLGRAYYPENEGNCPIPGPDHFAKSVANKNANSSFVLRCVAKFVSPL